MENIFKDERAKRKLDASWLKESLLTLKKKKVFEVRKFASSVSNIRRTFARKSLSSK